MAVAPGQVRVALAVTERVVATVVGRPQITGPSIANDPAGEGDVDGSGGLNEPCVNRRWNPTVIPQTADGVRHHQDRRGRSRLTRFHRNAIGTAAIAARTHHDEQRRHRPVERAASDLVEVRFGCGRRFDAAGRRRVLGHLLGHLVGWHYVQGGGRGVDRRIVGREAVVEESRAWFSLSWVVPRNVDGYVTVTLSTVGRPSDRRAVGSCATSWVPDRARGRCPSSLIRPVRPGVTTTHRPLEP